MATYNFYVSGIHCQSCKVLIEDVINKQPGVSQASVNIFTQCLTVTGKFTYSPEAIITTWSKILSPHNYTLSLDKPLPARDLKSTVYALPIGLFFLALFFLLQRSGLINFGFEGGLSFSTAFLIGIIASLSTCLAVVGGLVLSLSAKVAPEVKSIRPFIFFHLGRLVSFAALGGVLGAISSMVAINGLIAAIFGIIASVIMIILGINLLDIFHPLKRWQLALPRQLFDRLTKAENGFGAPFIVGGVTFFLPCGFTQSMQIAALASGSFWSGSLLMAVFALGTLPMLSLLSFGSFSFARARFAPLFFKSAGVVVIGLGLFALLSALVSLSIVKPIFNI